MAIGMKMITAGCIALLGITVIAYQYWPEAWIYSLAITAGTTAYHFVMRLVVGHLYDRFMKNQADYSKKWFQPNPIEQRIYARLRIKQWKSRIPSYQPDLFSPRIHSWHEIAQAMCQAELVHETIVLLSFVPVIAAYYVGDFYVFLITSTAAASFDMIFVMLQRYNRPRVVRLAMREQNHSKEKEK